MIDAFLKLMDDDTEEVDIKTLFKASRLNVFAPACVNFTRKIDPHRHVRLPKELLDPNTWEPGDAITMRPSIANGWKPNRAGL